MNNAKNYKFLYSKTKLDVFKLNFLCWNKAQSVRMTVIT